VHQPGLAHARLGDELDHASLPRLHRGHQSEQGAALALPADHLGPRGALRRPVDDPADDAGLDGHGLALDQEGRELGDVVPSPSLLQGGRRGHQSARLGSTHHPGGQVGGIAHDGVGAPVVVADVDGEGASPVHPGPHGDLRRGRLEDVEHAGEGPVGIVLRRRGGTGDEEDLPAVLVEVGGEEPDTVPLTGCLGGGDQPVEDPSHRLRAPGRE
jgi:hypothetical protein